MQMKFAAAALTILLMPAMVAAQKTSYDFDKTVDFTGIKTYALKEGTNVGQKLIDDRIVAAIEEQLAAKGFTKSERSRRVRRVSRRVRHAEGHLDLQQRLWRRLWRVRLGLGRRLGGRLDEHAGARHRRRHAGDRHRRRQEERRWRGAAWA